MLIPHIFEFALNNIRLEGGFLEDREKEQKRLFNTSDVLAEILRTIALKGSKLMKLKVTKMNLRSENVVQQLIETVQYNRNLFSLDLSYG